MVHTVDRTIINKAISGQVITVVYINSTTRDRHGKYGVYTGRRTSKADI